MLKGFFAQAKTVEFMQLRVKLFCPKIDPLFWDFCLWGGGGRGGRGGGVGGEKDAFWSPLSGKKKFAKISLWVQCAEFAWQNILECTVLPGNTVLPAGTLSSFDYFFNIHIKLIIWQLEISWFTQVIEYKWSNAIY